MSPSTRSALFLLVIASALATACVSPSLDDLTNVECRESTDCSGSQVCVQLACVARDLEVCDGFDNDGNGRVDEDFDLDTDPVNCGVCGRTCPGACERGECAGSSDLGPESDGGCVPTDEVCDGLDNDCDEVADNGVLNACGLCGEVPEETCDEADNDCDGATDEGLEICMGSCVIPAEAPCNGVDDNCDGAIDDAPEPDGGCEQCVDAEVACDGLDEDCDGTPDDGLTNACDLCGDVPVEVCNGLDEDCDETVDEEIVAEGEPCSAGIGACNQPGMVICDAPLGSGTTIEPTCVATPGQPSAELCGNEVDDDCDESTDEGFAEALGQPCEIGRGICFATGTSICGEDGAVQCDAVSSEPRPEECNLLDDNCDGTVDEVFDFQGDPENCGVCGRSCMALNATSACENGDCILGECDPGFLDLDGRVVNGCECEPRAEDVPDPEALDSNCDGVDGNATVSIFVSAARGNDCVIADGSPDPACDGLDPGSVTAPVRTLTRALALAAERGFQAILLEQGDYTRNTAFTLDRDLQLYGGFVFDPPTRTWARPAVPLAPTVIRAGRLRGEPSVVISPDATVRLEALTIEAPAAADGQSAIAIRADRCAALTLSHVVVTAGDGGAGGQGPVAQLPLDNGNVGRAGSGGTGGRGGVNLDCPDGTVGGNGGDGTPQNQSRDGIPGSPGGLGALGGDGGHTPDVPALTGEDSGPGLSGEPGQPGAQGGMIGATGAWLPHPGQTPVTGQPGGGGGGGGGGVSGQFVPEIFGPGGGGGGAGACGGNQGGNGTGGGASIGILVSGTCALHLEATQIRTSVGGPGGLGTPGTAGARGRTGGGPSEFIGTGPDEVPAAAGGRGGDGGCGGNGAGGTGGPSVGILRVEGTPAPRLDAETVITAGLGGRPGDGAPSNCRAGSAPGGSGQAGIAVSIGCCLGASDCGPDLACPDL